MKRRISIFLLIACLLLSTLVGCAPVAPSIDDTPAPTPDAAADPSSQAGEDEKIPADDIVIEPITPITPIEPIEDYQLPKDMYLEGFMYIYSMEEYTSLMEAIPYLSENSEAFKTLQSAGYQTAKTYYTPNPNTIPEGYELIYIKVSPGGLVFMYSSTPEKYQEFPWYWPKETSLDYTITYEWLHTYNQIGLNGARVDATDLVIAHTVGNTDHVTH